MSLRSSAEGSVVIDVSEEAMMWSAYNIRCNVQKMEGDPLPPSFLIYRTVPALIGVTVTSSSAVSRHKL